MVNNYRTHSISTTRLALSIVLFFCSIQVGLSQVSQFPAAVPSGSSQRQPLGVFFGYERSQMRYSVPSELNIPSGSFINGISFFLASTNTSTGTPPLAFEVKAYVREVTSVTVPASTYPAALGSLTPAFTGLMQPTAWSPAGQWITLTFTSPLLYGGSAALEFLVETNYCSSTGDCNGWYPDGSENAIYFDRTTGVGNTFQTWAADGSPPTFTGFPTANRPSIRVDWVPAPPCTFTPSPITTNASSTGVCGGETFFLTLSGIPQNSGFTYQWNYSTNGCSGPWSPIAGATNATYVATQSVNTCYHCAVTCVNSGGTVASTPIAVNMDPYLACYCASAPTQSVDGDIGKVDFGPILTGNCTPVLSNPLAVNQYTNNTAIPGSPFQFTQGVNYPIDLCQITSGTFQFASFFNVFIDYNQDGGFDPVDERVFSGGPTSSSNTPTISSVSGNITIPYSSVMGVTRLRISLIETGDANSPPCGPFGWGEVEDYNINIVAGTICNLTNAGSVTSNIPSVCVNQKFTLSITGNVTVGSFQTWQWQSSPTGLAGSWANIIGANGATYVTTQTSSTYYQCILTCPTGGTGIATALHVQMAPPSFCVCNTNLHATACTNSYVNTVQFNTLSNVNTGCANNTAQAYNVYPPSGVTTTAVTQDNTYLIAVETGGALNQSVSCWIDLDFDGLLEGTEWFQVTDFMVPGWYSIPVYIPINVVNSGVTIMRIRSRNSASSTGNGPNDACTQFFSGETEDYFVTINPYIPPPCGGQPPPLTAVSSAPPGGQCSGKPVNLSLNGIPLANGNYVYQWEKSEPCGGTYAIIPGATAKTYAATNVSTATSYRCVVKCGPAGTPTTSSAACVNILPNFWLGTSTDWGSPVNWCSSTVPTINDDVSISRTNPGVSSPYFCPVLGRSDTLRAKNLLIETNDTLTVYNDTLNAYNQAEAVTVKGKFIIRTSPGDVSTFTFTNSGSALSSPIFTPFRNNIAEFRMQMIFTQSDFVNLTELQTGQDLVTGLSFTLSALPVVYPTNFPQNYTVSYSWLPTTTTGFVGSVPLNTPNVAFFASSYVVPASKFVGDTVIIPMTNFKWRTDSNLVIQICYDTPTGGANPNAVSTHQVKYVSPSPHPKMTLCLQSGTNSFAGCGMTVVAGVSDNFGPRDLRPSVKFLFNRPYKRIALGIGGDINVKTGGTLISTQANLNVIDSCINNGTMNLDSTDLTIGNVLLNTGTFDLSYVFSGTNKKNNLIINGTALTNSGTLKVGSSNVTLNGANAAFTNSSIFNGGSGTVTLSGASATMSNSGTLAGDSGLITLNGASNTFTNAVGGTVNAGKGNIYLNGSTSSFTNAGTFNANTGGVITKGTVFNNDGTFNSGTGSVGFNGTGNTTLGGTSPISFYRLRLNKGAHTNIVALTNDAVTVTDSINLVFGTLNLNSKTLTFTNPNILTMRSPAATGGYIAGNDSLSQIKWTINNTTGTHIFPFYKLPHSVAINDNYVPFEFQNLLAAENIGDITAYTYATAANNSPLPPGVYHIHDAAGVDNGPDMADRYWYVKRSTPASGTSNTTMVFSMAVQTERAGPTGPTPGTFYPNGTALSTVSNNIRMQPYYETPTPPGPPPAIRTIWAPPPGGQSTSIVGLLVSPRTYRTTVPNYTWPLDRGTANPWAMANIASANGPLPIELLDFSAKLSGTEAHPEVKLFWTTLSEEDNDFFTVQRTLDFNSITEVGMVPSQGNSNSSQNYELYDYSPVYGKVNYYRLKQTDINNAYAYFPGENSWVPVRIGLSQAFMINYVSHHDKLEVMFEYDGEGPVDVTVTDITGRSVYNAGGFVAREGLNILPIEAKGWSEGMYLITLRDKDRQVSHKIFY